MLLAWTLTGAAVLAAAASAGSRAAEALYRTGTLPDGQPLRGERSDGASVTGKAAACVSCHRRSGLGELEGGIVVPPIAGDYLYRPAVAQTADGSTVHAQRFAANRAPYTEATLAAAIRSGRAPDGRVFNPLMPRYALDPHLMSALIAYLRSLGGGTQAGVDEQTLHFATIITPEADAESSAGMLQVLNNFFAEKSVLLGGTSRPMHTARNLPYRVARKWQLHVWRLQGDPQSWPPQLHSFIQREPVWAVISGIGGAHWRPVHEFCESEALPCLLPNVDLPVDLEGSFYTLYYSRGVLLEADLIAERLRGEASARLRVRQIVGHDERGAAAAQELERVLAGSSLSIRTERLAAGDPAGPGRDTLARMAQDADVVVLWLDADELRSLADPVPAGVKSVFASGLMGGLEGAPLSPSWRMQVRMTYPFDLPQSRRTRLSFAERWFKMHDIAARDERILVDTYLACSIASEAVGHMQDTFTRDYLLERIEDLISHRLVTGYYPRLGLAQGQRFASKGGYIVRFVSTPDSGIAAESEWLTP